MNMINDRKDIWNIINFPCKYSKKKKSEKEDKLRLSIRRGGEKRALLKQNAWMYTVKKSLRIFRFECACLEPKYVRRGFVSGMLMKFVPRAFTLVSVLIGFKSTGYIR